jgi:putative glycosyltransferase (TIGR04372 family)
MQECATMKILRRGYEIFLCLFIAGPIIGLARIIWPILKIRTGWFICERIGHFAFDTEYYLTEKKILRIPRTIDIFHYSGDPANSQWDAMIKRTMYFPKFPLLGKNLHRVNKLLPGGRMSVLKCCSERGGSRDVKDIWNRTRPSMSFTNDEDEKARKILRSVGVGEDCKFICLLVRDDAYLGEIHDMALYSYHRYRNSDVDTFKDAMLYLADQNIWVFRMGKITEKKLGFRHPLILDYSNSDLRSDFMDIWLAANCSLMVTTGAGLDSVADAFRRPILYINLLPIGNTSTWNSQSMTAFKKLVRKDTNQSLTLQQMIENNSLEIEFFESLEYQSRNIRLTPMTNQEILDATKDMMRFISEDFRLTNEQMALQSQFWKIMKQWQRFSEKHGVIRSKISPSYLKNNATWLLNGDQGKIWA